jgi:hypothetical protein
VEDRLVPAADPGVIHNQGAVRDPEARWRKLVLAPDSAPAPPMAPHTNSTLVKAIAHAFRWQKMLETPQYTNHLGCRLSAARRLPDAAVLHQGNLPFDDLTLGRCGQCTTSSRHSAG